MRTFHNKINKTSHVTFFLLDKDFCRCRESQEQILCLLKRYYP